MEGKIIKEDKNEFKLELKGEGHTLCAIIQRELVEDPDVEVAGYDVPHPLLNTATLYLRTSKGKKPRKVLIKALSKVKEKLEEFSIKFEEAMSKGDKSESQLE